jgi:hypothetical protein
MSKACLFAAALLLSGCGKELARVPFSGEGSNTVAATLAAGKVAFWTDLDVEYKGSAALEYRIALMQGGRRVATAVCDPLGRMSTQLAWVEIDRGAAHSRSGNGKMACSATLPKGALTTVEASLEFTARPLSATITKADLVVKQ